MEDSFLHELLLHKMYKFRKELEKNENSYSEWLKETREKINNSFSKEQIELVDKYLHDFINWSDYIDLQLNVRLLNYGVMIGMQLQKAFNKFEED